MKVWILKLNEDIYRVYVADSFLTRLRGLIGRKLKTGEALLLYPCNQIHCMFMKYPIDIIYLSRDKRIIHIDYEMKPGMLGKRIKAAYYVLEMVSQDAGRLGIQTGDILNFSEEA